MSEGKDVWLIIKSEILYDSDEPDDADVQTFQTEGRLFEKNDALYVMYEETEISGMKGDKTLLKIDKDVFSMRRYGAHQSEFVFIKDVETSSLYKTPYGIFSMLCYTNKLKIEREPFEIEVEYKLTIEGLTKSSNKLNVRL